MTSLSDYNSAHRLRDIIRKIVRKEIDQARPAPRYATVATVDAANFKVEVQYPNESTFAIVGMGKQVAPAVGDIVRVLGPVGDRYIDGVMGVAAFDGGTTGGPHNLYVQDTNPGLTIPGVWVQTGLGTGHDISIWVEDGI